MESSDDEEGEMVEMGVEVVEMEVVDEVVQ